MKVVILVCNKYTWLVPVFMHFYEKYWRENPYTTVIVNEATYLGSRDLDPEGTYWSTWVINYLKHCTEDKLLLIMEDFIIRDQIDTERVKLAASLCVGDVGCVRLNAPDKWFRRHGKEIGIKGFKEYPLNQKYSVSLQAAIWQKACLLDILRESESAWQTEHHGSRRLRELINRWRILWAEPTIIDYHPGGIMEKGELRLETVQQTLLNLVKEA